MDKNILVEFATWLFFCKVHDQYVLSSMDIEDKVICRCQMYNGEQKSFFPPASKHLFSWGSIFLQKTLHFILYLCTFSLLRKGSVLRTLFELHAIIGTRKNNVGALCCSMHREKVLKTEFSWIFQIIFKNSFTSLKRLRCLPASSWRDWDLLVLKTKLNRLALKFANFSNTRGTKLNLEYLL